MAELFINDIPSSLTINGDIAIDCESLGLNLHRDRLCVIQIATSFSQVFMVHFKDAIYDAPNLKKALSENKGTKIFHYARFDLAMIRKYLELDLFPVFCTKIASKIARTYTDHHGLKSLCYELLSEHLPKQQQSSFWGQKTLTPEQKHYAANDVIYLHKIRDVLTDMLKKENRYHLVGECFNFIRHIVTLDIAGWNDTDIFSH